jgi:hypothetical protein
MSKPYLHPNSQTESIPTSFPVWSKYTTNVFLTVFLSISKKNELRELNCHGIWLGWSNLRKAQKDSWNYQLATKFLTYSSVSLEFQIESWESYRRKIVTLNKWICWHRWKKITKEKGKIGVITNNYFKCDSSWQNSSYSRFSYRLLKSVTELPFTNFSYLFFSSITESMSVSLLLKI